MHIIGTKKNAFLSEKCRIDIWQQKELKLNCVIIQGRRCRSSLLKWLHAEFTFESPSRFISKFTFPWETIYWSRSGGKAAGLRLQRMSSIPDRNPTDDTLIQSQRQISTLSFRGFKSFWGLDKIKYYAGDTKNNC